MGPPPDSPPRVSGRNGHRLLPPHRELEGILAPLARTFAPWFTGRDRVMVMAALAEAGKMRPAVGDEVLVKGRHVGDGVARA